jgi:hypothetical protein
MHGAYLYRSGKVPKTTKKVRTGAAKAGATTKAKLNNAAIMAKIEANIRRKVKTYLTKQKRGMRHSRYSNKRRGRLKTKS